MKAKLLAACTATSAAQVRDLKEALAEAATSTPPSPIRPSARKAPHEVMVDSIAVTRDNVEKIAPIF